MIESLVSRLEQWLYTFGFERHIDEMNRIFAEPIVYSKTQDPRMTGHLNDFKKCAVFDLDWDSVSFEEVNQCLMDRINGMPVNLCKAALHLWFG